MSENTNISPYGSDAFLDPHERDALLRKQAHAEKYLSQVPYDPQHGHTPEKSGATAKRHQDIPLDPYEREALVFEVSRIEQQILVERNIHMTAEMHRALHARILGAARKDVREGHPGDEGHLQLIAKFETSKFLDEHENGHGQAA